MAKKKAVEENQEVYSGDVAINDNNEETVVMQGEPQMEPQPQQQQDPIVQSIAVLVNAVEVAYMKNTFTMEEAAFLYQHLNVVKNAIGMNHPQQ